MLGGHNQQQQLSDVWVCPAHGRTLPRLGFVAPDGGRASQVCDADVGFAKRSTVPLFLYQNEVPHPNSPCIDVIS